MAAPAGCHSTISRPPSRRPGTKNIPGGAVRLFEPSQTTVPENPTESKQTAKARGSLPNLILLYGKRLRPGAWLSARSRSSRISCISSGSSGSTRNNGSVCRKRIFASVTIWSLMVAGRLRRCSLMTRRNISRRSSFDCPTNSRPIGSRFLVQAEAGNGVNLEEATQNAGDCRKATHLARVSPLSVYPCGKDDRGERALHSLQRADAVDQAVQIADRR